jgi:hypothetical protein
MLDLLRHFTSSCCGTLWSHGFCGHFWGFSGQYGLGFGSSSRSCSGSQADARLRVARDFPRFVSSFAGWVALFLNTKCVVRTVVFSAAIVGGILTGLAIPIDRAEAFTASENEKFKAAIAEAKARARDFRGHRERNAKFDAERDKGIEKVLKARRRLEEAQDQALRVFLQNRASQDQRLAEQIEGERLWEKRQREEEAERERLRHLYVLKRDRIQRIIENEARIDEAVEYGLENPPVVSQSP